MSYDYNIVYKKGKEHGNADFTVGSVNIITSTEWIKGPIFGMRGHLGLTINSGRGATLKYL